MKTPSLRSVLRADGERVINPDDRPILLIGDAVVDGYDKGPPRAVAAFVAVAEGADCDRKRGRCVEQREVGGGLARRDRDVARPPLSNLRCM